MDELMPPDATEITNEAFWNANVAQHAQQATNPSGPGDIPRPSARRVALLSNGTAVVLGSFNDLAKPKE